MSAATKQCHYFTLWIKQLSRIKKHSVITDNCKKIRPEYQPATVRFDYMQTMKTSKATVITRNTSELKAVFEMTAVHPGSSGKTTPLTHSCSNHGVIQVGPLDVWGRRDQWCVFCTPSLAVRSTRHGQLDLNLVNSNATVAARWTLAFIFPGPPR